VLLPEAAIAVITTFPRRAFSGLKSPILACAFLSATQQFGRFRGVKRTRCDHRKLVAPDPERHFATAIYRIAKGSFRGTGNMEHRPVNTSTLLRFNACGLDYVGPPLGFVGEELTEIVGQACNRNAAQIGQRAFIVG
jgi:hypothetical protein